VSRVTYTICGGVCGSPPCMVRHAEVPRAPIYRVIQVERMWLSRDTRMRRTRSELCDSKSTLSAISPYTPNTLKPGISDAMERPVSSRSKRLAVSGKG